MKPKLTTRELQPGEVAFAEAARQNSAELGKLILEYEPIPPSPMLSHPPAGNKPKRDEAGRFIYETPASE